MTPVDRDADRVRRAISDLRAQDAQQAPRFQELLARPRRQPKKRPMPLPWLALAVVLIAAATLGYRSATSRANRLTLPREVALLSSWRPATDVFLVSGGSLLRSPSPFSESIINLDSHGDRR